MSKNIPSFANETASKKLKISTKRFVCIGDQSPLDHPHIYLEMGDKDKVRCPYCSTLYLYNKSVEKNKSVPA